MRWRVGVSFIHTADWQLGKPFANRSEAARPFLEQARFDAVRKIGAIATERRADAVLVAGDVFDSAIPSELTIRNAIIAMESFAGAWVLLPGNHDPALPEGVWTRLYGLGAKENIIVAARPEPILLAEGRLAVLPAPLTRRQESADLTGWFDAALTAEGAVRVGLAHGSIPSCLPEDADARNPVAADRVERARLDYLALGDWHGCVRIGARSWYSGTPEADRAKDNLSGTALLVRIARPSAEPEVQSLPIGLYFWHKLGVVLHQAADVDALAERVRALEAPLDRHVVDLVLQGTLDLASRVRLQRVLADLAARVRDLRCDDTRLLALPSDADLQRIGRGGFVGEAVARLRRLSAAGDTVGDAATAATARLALQILYLESTQPEAVD
jgi:DNA repair exonuclease SbcCD nuclease subunit